MLGGGTGCDCKLHLILGHLGQANICSVETAEGLAVF